MLDFHPPPYGSEEHFWCCSHDYCSVGWIPSVSKNNNAVQSHLPRALYPRPPVWICCHVLRRCLLRSCKHANLPKRQIPSSVLWQSSGPWNLQSEIRTARKQKPPVMVMQLCRSVPTGGQWSCSAHDLKFLPIHFFIHSFIRSCRGYGGLNSGPEICQATSSPLSSAPPSSTSPSSASPSSAPRPPFTLCFGPGSHWIAQAILELRQILIV